MTPHRPKALQESHVKEQTRAVGIASALPVRPARDALTILSCKLSLVTPLLTRINMVAVINFVSQIQFGTPNGDRVTDTKYDHGYQDSFFLQTTVSLSKEYFQRKSHRDHPCSFGSNMKTCHRAKMACRAQSNHPPSRGESCQWDSI